MKLTVLALLAALAAPLAFAQDTDKAPAPPRGGDRPERQGGDRAGRGGPNRMLQMITIFQALDADKDGELSAEEIKGAVAALKSCDKNKDGKLTGEEIMQPFGGRGGRGGAGGGARPGRGDGERPARPQRPDADN